MTGRGALGTPAHHLREAGEELVCLMEMLNLIEMAASALSENERAAIKQGLEQAQRLAANTSESLMWAQDARRGQAA